MSRKQLKGKKSKRRGVCGFYLILGLTTITLMCFANIYLVSNGAFQSNIQPTTDHGSTVDEKPLPFQSNVQPTIDHGSTSDEKPLPINSDWPAIAHEAPGHPLVTKGDSFFHSARQLYFEKDPNGKRLIDEFLEIYKNRPDKVNLCGIRINHALALFLAIKEINPTLVVESGVNAGQSTYFIRAASPTTRIFAIDPEEEAICNQGKRWLDDSPLTTNYTGKNFKDLLDLDWKGMIERKEVDPDKTLVFLDDHLHTYDRIQSIAKTGLKKVLVEDNYKIGEGKLIYIYILLVSINLL